MDASFPPSFMQTAGFQNPAGPSSQLPSDSIDPTQQFDPASLYEFVSSSSNGQGLSMPPYGEAFASHGIFPNVDNRSSGYSNVPAVTGSNFANMSSNMNTNMSHPIHTLPTMPAIPDTFGEFARQWSNFTQPPTGPPMTGSLPRYSYYPNTVTHSSPPVQNPMFTTEFTETPDEAQPHQPQNAFPHGQAMMSTGAPTTNSGAAFRQSRNAPTFPQSGTSVASSHQRRNQRNTAFRPTPVVPAHHRTRSNTQSSRGRTRPTSMTGTTTYTNALPPQQPTSHSQRSHVSVNSSLDTPAPLERVLDDDQIDNWLRNMRPSEFQAIYEGSLSRSSRVGPSFFIPQSAGKKILDTPQEIRPEPKETDELTVNMECKICMGQLVDTVLFPCGHAILCRWCADQHIPSSKGYPKGKANCPMCREPVRQKHRIYFP